VKFGTSNISHQQAKTLNNNTGISQYSAQYKLAGFHRSSHIYHVMQEEFDKPNLIAMEDCSRHSTISEFIKKLMLNGRQNSSTV